MPGIGYIANCHITKPIKHSEFERRMGVDCSNDGEDFYDIECAIEGGLIINNDKIIAAGLHTTTELTADHCRKMQAVLNPEDQNAFLNAVRSDEFTVSDRLTLGFSKYTLELYFGSN